MINPGDLVWCDRDISLWHTSGVMPADEQPAYHVAKGTFAIVLARFLLREDMHELLVLAAGRIGWQVEPSFQRVTP